MYTLYNECFSDLFIHETIRASNNDVALIFLLLKYNISKQLVFILYTYIYANRFSLCSGKIFENVYPRIEDREQINSDYLLVESGERLRVNINM